MSTNGTVSDAFAIGRGTRQGCPLSPLIFALILEPLAQKIREDDAIKGILIGNNIHKISLHADDIVLFLTHPDTSLKALLNLIDSFSSFSGYKINWGKSEILSLAKTGLSTSLNHPPFQVKPKIKYLGIVTDSNFNNLYKLNYLPLLQNIGKDLARWTSLPLSLMGRVNVIKMNVLPRLVYLFQSIPADLPDSFFSKCNNMVGKFIWCNKVARIKRSTLYLPIERGGLGLPDMQLYYWAAQFRPIFYWFGGTESPSWTQIESHILDREDLSHIPYCFNNKNIKKYTEYNPIIIHSIKIWCKVNRYLECKPSLSPLTPIMSNSSLEFVQQDNGFRVWAQKNITKISHLYHCNVLMSFQQLKETYQIPTTHFFRYLQLRHYIKSQLGGSPDKPKLSKLESLLTKEIARKHMSLIYKLLLAHSKANTNLVRRKWESDLGMQFDDDQWFLLFKDAHKDYISVRYKLFQTDSFILLKRLAVSRVILPITALDVKLRLEASYI